MSKFYGEMSGADRKTVTRRGHSHLSAHLRGWNKSIRVECSEDDSGKEVYKVYETGGSNNPSSDKLVYTTTY